MPLSISCRKVHEYIGMTFDYMVTSEVKTTMYDYIDNPLISISEVYKSGIGFATPVLNNFDEVRHTSNSTGVLLNTNE